MDDVRVKTWSELHERLYEGSWQEPLRRFRSTFAFRGMADASAPLATGLQILAPGAPGPEAPLLRNFRKYASSKDAPGESVWNWLALAQHHGLPTRLLDWTFSPYVALHFATDEPRLFDRDGVVWAVDYTRVHRLLPAPLRRVLEAECADVFTTELLAGVVRTLPELNALSEEPFLLFVDPPSLDQRIVNQFAVFSMMSSVAARLDEWLESRRHLARRLVFPASLKWEIRDKLDQANVTERVLFPGLDGLSRWLKRYYSPRDEQASETGQASRPPANEDDSRERREDQAVGDENRRR